MAEPYFANVWRAHINHAPLLAKLPHQAGILLQGSPLFAAAIDGSLKCTSAC
jgi:hypothetical protein